MKDKMPTQDISWIKAPKLEGHVKIELFNAKTGELEDKVEGKNIVTNVVRDIFAANNFGAMDYQSLLPLYKTMFGGILCYHDPLTENADNYFLPTDNQLVGHAGQTTYSSAEADTTRGLPNSELSGPVAGGYTYVWNFPETQGNGLISAIAMCPPDVGDYYMYGTRFNPVIAPTAVDSTVPDATQVFPQIWDDENHCAYAVIYTAASSVTIRKYTAFGNMDNISFMQEKVNNLYSEVGNQYEEHVFTISNAARSKVFWIGGDIVILIPNATTIDKHIIDVSDWTMTDSTLSPDLGGGQLSVRQNQYNAYYPDTGPNWECAVYCELDEDGYFYMANSRLTGVYKIKYSSVADVSLIAGSTTCEALGVYGYFCLGKWACFLYNRNYLAVTDGTTWWGGFPTGLVGTFIDNQRNFAALLSCNKANNSPVRTYSQGTWYVYGQGVLQSIGYIRCVPYKLFLSTIKNLPNPRTKLSTQTMTITYTITEATE